MHRAIAAAFVLLSAGCVGIGGDDGPIDPQTLQGKTVPVVTVDPPAGAVTTTFTFDASGTDVPGGDASYDWDFGDGGTANGEVVQHVFAYDNNAYRVVLRISVDEASVEEAVIVPVGSGVNAKPTGSMDVSTGWAGIGKPVTFTAKPTDPDGDPVTVVWLLAEAQGEGGGHAHPGGDDGHDHGADATFGLDTTLPAQGLTLEHAFDKSGTYRVTASLRDPKGARTDLPAVLKVTESVPRDHIAVEETGTLIVGTADTGVSLTLYDLMQPSQNTFIDAARYDMAVRYPGTGTATLAFTGAGGAGPADLDLRILSQETGETVAEFANLAPAVAAGGSEGGELQLEPGVYTVHVLGRVGAAMDYTLVLDLSLDVPGLAPFTVHAAGHEGDGDGHAGHGH